jgi:hypothetical protein
MATAHDPTAAAFFLLTAWCAATRQWFDLLGRFDSPQDAERLAFEPVCDGRRRGMQPFAIVDGD